MNLECKHKLLYNFSTLPNKAICKKCKKKYALNLHKLDWEETLYFENETRSDEELIKKWAHTKTY